jgi:hypothetical protein
MTKRYDVRKDSIGWTIYDVFTGEAAVIRMDAQTGLTEWEARYVQGVLNHKGFKNYRPLRQ